MIGTLNIVATHMTDRVTTSAWITGLAVLAAVVLACVTVRRRGLRRPWRPAAGVCALLVTVGVVGSVNTGRLHHLHVCHEHNLDTCGQGHGQVDDHTHTIARWP